MKMKKTATGNDAQMDMKKTATDEKPVKKSEETVADDTKEKAQMNDNTHDMKEEQMAQKTANSGNGKAEAEMNNNTDNTEEGNMTKAKAVVDKQMDKETEVQGKPDGSNGGNPGVDSEAKKSDTTAEIDKSEFKEGYGGGDPNLPVVSNSIYSEENRFTGKQLKAVIDKHPLKVLDNRASEELDGLVEIAKTDPGQLIEDQENSSVKLRDSVNFLHLADNYCGGALARYAWKIGTVFLAVKNELAEQEGGFAKFVQKTGNKVRTIQKYIRLAKCPEIEKHLHLGMERLDVILAAKKQHYDTGSIEDFFKRYNIDYKINALDQKSVSVDDLKVQIAKGILKTLETRKGWEINDDRLLEKFAKKEDGSIDYGVLEEKLDGAKKSGGSAKTLLENLIEGDKGSDKYRKKIDRLMKIMKSLADRLSETGVNSNTEKYFDQSIIDALWRELKKFRDSDEKE